MLHLKRNVLIIVNTAIYNGRGFKIDRKLRIVGSIIAW